jgi:hypothetical protein
MAVETFNQPSFSRTNLWSQVRSYAARGGFQNGLNPAIVGRIWYVNANTVASRGPIGANGNDGLSPFTPFATVARALTFIDSYDVIVLSGVIREQVMTPVGVFDVTVIGAGNRPRQATSNGVATGGGASWLSPTSPTATTALIQVIEQSWSFVNIQFAPVASSDCIRFRRMETATIPDGSHGRVSNCYFSTGGAAGCGINVGECKRILIENNEFEALGTGTAIRNTADGGVANTNYGHIVGNRFGRGNAGDIIVSADNYLIENNVFQGVFATEGGWRINLNGGNIGNQVINNYVADVDTTIALGFKKAVAADIWRNFVATVVDPKVVVPA